MVVVCGDWNTRIGNLAPQINEVQTVRCSNDPITNQRASWLIDTCEQQGWKILNGLQPGPSALHTFQRGSDKSCIDFIMTNTAIQSIEYDPHTLMGFSDHILVKTHIPIIKWPHRKKGTTGAIPETIYKWREGTSV